MNHNEVLEQGTVVEAADTHLLVEVEGVELFVGSRVRHTGCRCCGDTVEFTVSYNRLAEHRVEEHGEADPLGLED
jgi:hypothetical protein